MRTRWMLRKHLPEVVELDRDSYGDDHWDKDDFCTILNQRNCIGMVAEDDDHNVLGFVIYVLHPHHLMVMRFIGLYDEVAEVLVDMLKAKLSKERKSSVSLVMHERSTDSLLLMQSLGFYAVGCCGDLIKITCRYDGSQAPWEPDMVLEDGWHTASAWPT